MKYAMLIFALLVSVSGCVSQTGRNEGLVVTMHADPPQIFQNQATIIFVDIDNTADKKIHDVNFEVFDTGIMSIIQGVRTQDVVSRDQRENLQYNVNSGDVLWNIVKRYYPELRTDPEIAAKVNEIVGINRNKYPEIVTDNKMFDQNGRLVTGSDGIKGDLIKPEWMLTLPGAGNPVSAPSEKSRIQICRESFASLSPKEFRTLSCRLSAGEVREDITNRISAKTTFTADFDAVHLIEMVSRQEYERRKAAGSFTTSPRKYTYSDKNIAIDIEFSEDLPVIERDDKRYFIYMTVRNIGNGFVGDLGPETFIVGQGTSQAGFGEIFRNILSSDLVKCDRLKEKLSPIGKSFPRITCELLPPDNIDVVGNYPLSIKIIYTYETRQSLDVRIIK